MTTMQILLGRILTNRINEEKTKGVTDFTEITNTMDIFLAGDKITVEQYTTLKGLIT